MLNSLNNFMISLTSIPNSQFLRLKNRITDSFIKIKRENFLGLSKCLKKKEQSRHIKRTENIGGKEKVITERSIFELTENIGFNRRNIFYNSANNDCGCITRNKNVDKLINFCLRQYATKEINRISLEEKEAKKKKAEENDELEWIEDIATDPTQNYLQMFPDPLSAFFSPLAVAVVGATDRPGAVGRTVFNNLLKSNKMNEIEQKQTYKLYPVNNNRETCLGYKCFKNLRELKNVASIDLIVVVTPAKTVLDVVKDAAFIKAKAIIIITAGFKETGAAGERLEEEIIKVARDSNMRVLGPNCLGLINASTNLNATFASCMPKKGDIALISQSGAVCTAILDYANEMNVGFSSFISIGSMADVDFGDIISFLKNDKNTKSIIIYMESPGDVSSLLRSAKEVALVKPIIVIKSGKSEAAAKAAVSHTGSLVGCYDVFEAAMKRVGILIVDSIEELFNTVLYLGKQRYPNGSKILMITDAGGPAIIATDAVCKAKCHMANLSENCVQKLNEFLPQEWSHANPVDILGDADPKRYAHTLDVILEYEDPNLFNCILIILAPQDVTQPTKTAEDITDVISKHMLKAKQTKRKMPLIMASWMGGTTTKEGLILLNNFGVPTYQFPDEAIKIFAKLYWHAKYLENMYETSIFDVELCDRRNRQEKVKDIIDYAISNNHKFLTECKAKQLLKTYGIPVAEMLECHTVDEAKKNSEILGYPIVAKLNSYTITHKSNVKGVMLNLKSKEEVGNAYKKIHENVLKYGGKEEDFKGIAIQKMVDACDGVEIILGSSIDSTFGHTILFGTGGIFVEVFKDKALGIPPINSTLAKRLMESTKIYSALQGGYGSRFPIVDVEELANLVVRFSQMILDLKDIIDECEINPIIVNSKEFRALDARISLKSKNEKPTNIAIRPYPMEYCFILSLNDGNEIRIRPMCASDEVKLKKFHENLSLKAVKESYFENFDVKERTNKQNLIKECCLGYDNLIPLLAENTNTGEILGLCSIKKFGNKSYSGEIKMTLDDTFHFLGLSEILLKKAIYIAKEENLRLLHSLVLKENKFMITLLLQQNFEIKKHKKSENILDAYLNL